MAATSRFLSALSLILLLIMGSATCDDYYDITTINSNGTINAKSDPFQGTYSGVYGNHGTEYVQLKRKYGKWYTSDAYSFEYVEAVKLKGDTNVPTGQVTFRAKLGRKPSQPCSKGSQALASYIGQGRVAQTGFVNPTWVDGVLFQVNGKLQGADLGFLWLDQTPFLVLFKRLN